MMSFEELLDDVTWDSEPVLGTFIASALTDCFAKPIDLYSFYWIGKHKKGPCLIMPAEKKQIKK